MIKKKCITCGVEKENTDEYFNKSTRHTCGLNSKCKKCVNLYNTKSYYKNHKKSLVLLKIKRDSRNELQKQKEREWRRKWSKGKRGRFKSYRAGAKKEE